MCVKVLELAVPGPIAVTSSTSVAGLFHVSLDTAQRCCPAGTHEDVETRDKGGANVVETFCICNCGSAVGLESTGG